MRSTSVHSCLPTSALTDRPRKGTASIVFSAALLAVSTCVQAHTFCVSTATQLQNALTDSSDGGMYVGQINQVRVVAGTYNTGNATGNGPFHYSNLSGLGYFDLQGGWDAGCHQRTQKAALTVLDGNNTTRVLHLRQVANELDVSSFTIQHGQTNQVGAGLAINDGSGDNSEVVVSGNIIRDNHTSNSAGGIFASSATSYVEVYNNLITGNSADAGNGAGEVLAHIGSVEHNTVTRNTTTASGETGGLYFSSSASGFVDYNIFWNNTNAGIYLGSSQVQLDYNDIGVHGGSNPFTFTGDVSVDPGFVDAAGGNFHLTADSPLLGAMAVDGEYQSVDPDGNANTLASYGKTDAGAYNETIFKDGFDGG
jgi:parallel beta-helix repeat protein